MKVRYKTYRIDVFKETHDEWYPNYNTDQVRVSMSALYPDGSKWRVGVWGADDFGMHFDGTEREVQTVFMQLIGHKYLGCVDCERLGLVVF